MKNKRFFALAALILTAAGLALFLTGTLVEGRQTQTVSMNPFSQEQMDAVSSSAFGASVLNSMSGIMNATANYTESFSYTGFDCLGQSLPLAIALCAVAASLSLSATLLDRHKILGWAACALSAALAAGLLLLPTLMKQATGVPGSLTPMGIGCAALFLLAAGLHGAALRKGAKP